MYVCLGAVTEQAGKFARERGVEVGWGVGLAKLIVN